MTAAPAHHRTQSDLVNRPRVGERSPAWTAILSVVPLTAYGFWWWCALNRDLRARGEDTQPWQALTAVTLGWVTVVAPFRSVSDTTEAIAPVQRRDGHPATARSQTATRLAIAAA